MESRGLQKFAALVAALVIHSPLLFLVMSASSPRDTSDRVREGSDAPFSATVFFLDETNPVDVDGFALEPAFETVESITVTLPQLPELSAVAADSFEESQPILTAEQFSNVQQLQGIYTRQITDRIARVLQMTSSPEAAVAAPCIVHVVQNESGDVLDVDMRDCARPPATREALARAIRAASPLPPPPAGLAMGSYLTIDATML